MVAVEITESSSLVTLAVILAFADCRSDQDTFQGRRAWSLENDQLRVTVLEGGGHLAEMVLKNPHGEESLNPLWIPPWPSIEPWAFSFEQHADVYGRNSEAATLASVMGHNLCFDFWGAPSKDEFTAGLAYHGDVSLLRAEKLSHDASSITYRFDLTRSQTAMTRTLRLSPGEPVLYFEETAENKLSIDRPFGWVQHPTFGPPFLDETACFFDASATRGEVPALEQPDTQWPVGQPDQPELDFRRFAPKAPSQKMAYFFLDPDREVHFISAVNTTHVGILEVEARAQRSNSRLSPESQIDCAGLSINTCRQGGIWLHLASALRDHSRKTATTEPRTPAIWCKAL